MVALLVQAGQVGEALTYVERAKSRALLILLGHRVDIRIQARAPADLPLVEQLNQLRQERNTFLRQQAHELEPKAVAAEMRAKQQQLERQMTQLWHQLLIRNDAYAADSALAQVQTAAALPYLDSDTVLLEYYALGRQLIVFLLTTAGETQMVPLAADTAEVSSLLAALQLNLKLVVAGTVDRVFALLPNAQAVLQQLYRQLLAPLRPYLEGYQRLIVVPHGNLHYVPFHALYDGQGYLCESHRLSYLPASSFLPYCQNRPDIEGTILAAGYSFQGKVPHTLAEARMVAALWPQARLLLEDEVTRRRVESEAADYRIVHLATHGEFRADNSLFSGLALADGWLTTLDVFNLRLNASLVTLSACYTGQHVVGGGDELLGLARAFFAAGSSSLLMTHWAVVDYSTTLFMECFYQALAANYRKDEALQAAQRWLLRGEAPTGWLSSAPWQAAFAHPYFWAPFYLMGAAGPL